MDVKGRGYLKEEGIIVKCCWGFSKMFIGRLGMELF